MPRRSAASRPPSILDVAKAAGVSHQTVSRVLNDSERVAPKTRERVRTAIDALGYRRNSVARALVTRKSGILGIITTSSWHYGPTSILLAVEIAARSAGYYTVVSPIDDDDDEAVRTTLDRFLGLPVEGIVFIAPTRDIVSDIGDAQLDIPLVAVTAAPVESLPNAVVATIDQEAGSREAVDHLLSLGHTDIAHIGGPPRAYEARIRENVWRTMLSERGLGVRDLGVRGWSAEVGYQEGQAMAKGDLPTAVFCANDEIALGVYRAFAEGGIRIPEDVSVAGFDDLPQARYYRPALTTVAQDFEEIGRRIVDTMIGVIGGGAAPASVRLPSHLVVRASTCAPRKR